MKVSIVGTGYVGIVTGACLAEMGHEVICVDVDAEKVERISRAIPPIYERGLEELLLRNVGKRFHATTDLQQAVIDSEVTLIAVGTPFDGRQINLEYIRQSAYDIGHALGRKTMYHLVAVKSTVVPGTTDEVVLPILETASGKKAGTDFGVGMNPEFLTEGEAVEDFMSPDRLILGGMDNKAIDILTALYAPFQGVDQLQTNNRTAEMIKYVSNAMLATQISFANEMANLCSALGGVDIVDVMRGVHLSHYLRPKTGNNKWIQAPISSFLEAGCGFGGSCLPKDVKALIAHGEKLGARMPLMKAVIETNENQPDQIIRMLKKHFTSLKKIRVSILGLSFKPNTDDMRESPAIPVIRKLLLQGAFLKAFDPAANHEARKLFPDDQLTLCESLAEALADIDAAVLVTRWDQFSHVPELWSRLCPNAVFVDGRRMVDKQCFSKYEGIGL